jgi:gamma-glutamylcyclotransferase (GGCT)/AIG2-like uncharacterized protein YtfP
MKKLRNTKPSEHLLFVYGTMLTNCYNHGRISKQKLIGSATTSEVFNLSYKFSPRQIPYVHRPTTVDDFRLFAAPVVGELYSVDLDTLNHLDLREGHPFVYQREKINVYVETLGRVSFVECWAYIAVNFYKSECVKSSPECGLHEWLDHYDSRLHYDTQRHAINAFV